MCGTRMKSATLAPWPTCLIVMADAVTVASMRGSARGGGIGRSFAFARHGIGVVGPIGCELRDVGIFFRHVFIVAEVEHGGRARTRGGAFVKGADHLVPPHVGDAVVAVLVMEV